MSNRTETVLSYVVLINHPSGPAASSIAAAFADEESAFEYAVQCRMRHDKSGLRALGPFGFVVCELAEPVNVSLDWDPA